MSAALVVDPDLIGRQVTNGSTTGVIVAVYISQGVLMFLINNDRGMTSIMSGGTRLT